MTGAWAQTTLQDATAQTQTSTNTNAALTNPSFLSNAGMPGNVEIPATQPAPKNTAKVPVKHSMTSAPTIVTPTAAPAQGLVPGVKPFAGPVTPQMTHSDHPIATRAPGGKHVRQTLQQALNLTPEQEKQVEDMRKLVKDQSAAIVAAPGDEAVKRDKIMVLHQQLRTQLRSILNPEQQAKFDAMSRPQPYGGPGKKWDGKGQGTAPAIAPVTTGVSPAPVTPPVAPAVGNP